jgi:hypothetical protein
VLHTVTCQSVPEDTLHNKNLSQSCVTQHSCLKVALQIIATKISLCNMFWGILQ